MAEESGRAHDEHKKVQKAESQGTTAGAQGASIAPGAGFLDPGALLGDPRLNGRGNGPVHASVMQRAQQTYGNRAVQRFLQRMKADATPLTPQPTLSQAPHDPSIMPVQRQDSGGGGAPSGGASAGAPAAAPSPAKPASGGVGAGTQIPIKYKIPLGEKEFKYVKGKISFVIDGKLEIAAKDPKKTGQDAPGQFRVVGPGMSGEGGKGAAKGIYLAGVEHQQMVKKWATKAGNEYLAQTKGVGELTSKGFKVGAEGSIEGKNWQVAVKLTLIGKDWDEVEKVNKLKFATIALNVNSNRLIEKEIAKGVKIQVKLGFEGELEPNWKELWPIIKQGARQGALTALRALGPIAAGAAVTFGLYINGITAGKEIHEKTEEAAKGLRNFLKSYENVLQNKGGSAGEPGGNEGVKFTEGKLKAAEVPEAAIVEEAKKAKPYEEVAVKAKEEFRRKAIEQYWKDHPWERRIYKNLLGRSRGAGSGGYDRFEKVLDAKLDKIVAG